jgi:hypothetical protein
VAFFTIELNIHTVHTKGRRAEEIQGDGLFQRVDLDFVHGDFNAGGFQQTRDLGQGFFQIRVCCPAGRADVQVEVQKLNGQPF